MSEIQEMLLTVLSSAAVSAALAGAVVWLGRTWISERLKTSIKYEYDLKLSSINIELKAQADTQAFQLKSEIEKEAEKIRFATSTINESQKIVITRKLDGIDTLWSGVLKVRECVPGIMGIIDILTDDEYLTMGNHPQFEQMVDEFSTEKLKTMFMDNVGSLERIRPYVGEYLWAIFQIYQTLILQIAMLIQMGDTDAKKQNWHQDTGIRQLLNSSLTSVEIKSFDDKSIGKVDWLQKNYEFKILQAMEKVISGKEFGEEALKQAQEMEEKVQQLMNNRANRVDGGI